MVFSHRIYFYSLEKEKNLFDSIFTLEKSGWDNHAVLKCSLPLFLEAHNPINIYLWWGRYYQSEMTQMKLQDFCTFRWE